MDNWLDNPWFLKGVALLLALLLFSTAPESDRNTPGNVNVPSDENVEVLSDIPVKSYYDSENLIVSGIPETVEVTIQGPKNIVQQAKALRDFEVYVDLTDEEMGQQEVEIHIRDISEKLKVTIEPKYITVSIQEKVTKEFDVEAEFNTSLVEAGYLAGTPTIEPAKVQVTGAKDIIDRISYVKATVNSGTPIREDFIREAAVMVLDSDMNKLDVQVEPETVQVKIPVRSSSKEVPVEIVRNGTPPEGVTINSITSDVTEALILAPPDVLENVTQVRVEIDVSSIKEDTVMTLPIIISNGVVQVEPETAKLTVKVSREEDVTLSDIPIDVQGQNEEMEVTFLDPPNGLASVIVSGQASELSGIKKEDFQVLIDVSGLSEGEHSVDLNVRAPGDLRWSLQNQKQASISISRKNE